MKNRDTFSSKIGIVAASAGSAIGLGNIWKFPYMAGKNGGSAFIIIYLIAIILMGYPLVYTEFAMGRRAKTNAVDTFGIIGNKKTWNIVGFIAVLTVFLISTFYMMITGWVIYYFYHSLTGTLYNLSSATDSVMHFKAIFSHMSSSMSIPLIFSMIAIYMTALINSMGIKEGVEKYSKIMMPVLFVLFIFLIGYSATLPGFSKSMHFLFRPDFRLVTPQVIIGAIGQAFFSLSLGMGALITYGSYIAKTENIRQIARQVTLADTIIALFSGLLIFPAVFTYNLEPTAGPSLIFISLPQVFLKMPGGRWFSLLFFLLVIVAAITSMVSMLEILITYVIEKRNWSRKTSTWMVVIATTLGGAVNIAGEGPLSYITVGGRTIFSWLDYLTNNITIPLVAVLTAIIAGWVWQTTRLNKELEIGAASSTKLDHYFNLLLKWVIPPVIVILMIALLLGAES
ncbi:sodium-dependent transporter [Cellulosilyticum sp. I15G10I2]|uniref:sodium-dependent transporter n=1 Tax=Cellulosilyticum sp. I15G10I2 TaxID=1892843 RepID=UPI00085C70C2|nr:sodium-dependent transporter [Cellulosilyticum sp. I15G10I2]